MADALRITLVKPWEVDDFDGFVIHVVGPVVRGLRLSLHDCAVADDSGADGSVTYFVVRLWPIEAKDVTRQLLAAISTAMGLRHG